MRILAALLLLTFTTHLFGQGQVSFVNTASTRVIDAATGLPVPAGTAWMTQLWYAPDAPSAPGYSAFTALGSPIGFLLPGLFNGGTRSVAGTYSGDAGWFLVRVWSSSPGVETWEHRLASGTGRIAQSVRTGIIMGGYPVSGHQRLPAP